MEDTVGAIPRGTIAGLPAALCELDVGGRAVRLWTIADLEALVDRAAVLRGEVEPPYWAYLWSGARVLAAYVARLERLAGLRVLEVGSGLGLPGITAAVRGADVALVDVEPAAAAFAAASAAANGVACTTRVADLFELDPAWRFDLVLAAEVAYDRSRYPALAAALVRHLGAGGTALVADGYRTDTGGFYRAVAALGCPAASVDVRVLEEGRPVAVRVSRLGPMPDRRRGTRPPPP